MSTSAKSFSFAVMIPMYNEEVGAEECVRRVCGVLSAIQHRNALIVVNDGSKDSTAIILQQLAPEFSQLVIVTHETNKGYGAALRTGGQRAAQDGFDYVLFMDSDLTNDPEDIPKFVQKMEQGYDVIKATRYSHGGATEGVPAYRVSISRIGNLIAQALFRLPIRDCTNGFRAVRTSILKGIELKANNFSVIMEELFYLKYAAKSFANVPVVLTDRSEEQRPTSFRYRPGIFYDYLKYPLRSMCREIVLRGQRALISGGGG
jgi:dolichol-phosphate mannosyltransferase